MKKTLTGNMFSDVTINKNTLEVMSSGEVYYSFKKSNLVFGLANGSRAKVGTQMNKSLEK